MAKVSPYHSSDPMDADVYHDHDNCPVGLRIESSARQAGTGEGRRLCQQCRELGLASYTASG